MVSLDGGRCFGKRQVTSEGGVYRKQYHALKERSGGFKQRRAACCLRRMTILPSEGRRWQHVFGGGGGGDVKLS